MPFAVCMRRVTATRSSRLIKTAAQKALSRALWVKKRRRSSVVRERALKTVEMYGPTASSPSQHLGYHNHLFVTLHEARNRL
jgi:hypothetical protein